MLAVADYHTTSESRAVSSGRVPAQQWTGDANWLKEEH
jgi:hypothetical protein